MSHEAGNNQLAKPELPATGERFVPQSAADHIQVAYEHLHRYLFAQEFCRGLDVLDIASGEGYGSALLAQSARSVAGVDVSQEAVEHSRRKYQRENLQFHKGDCSKIPLPKHSVDVVVSFETIEHIHSHDRFLQEVKRVLRPKGVLIISSPDKHEYSDRNGYSNPFHVSELYRQDFLKLLRRHFTHCRGFQQRLVAGSYIAADQHSDGAVVYGTYRGNIQGGTFNEGVHEGLYAVAVCSNAAIPDILAGLFENRFESARVWDWYEQSGRVHRELSQLKESLAKQADGLLRSEQARAEMEKRLGEGQQRDRALQAGLSQQAEAGRNTEQELRARIAQLDREVVARGEWGKALDAKVAGLREQLDEAKAQLEKESKQTKKLQEEQAVSAKEQERLQGELKARATQLLEKDQELARLGEEKLRQEERLRSFSLEIEQLRRTLGGQEAIQASLRDDIQAQRDIVDDLVASKERLRNEMLLTVRDVQADLNGKQAEVDDLAKQLAALVQKNQELDREVVARGEWGMRLDKEIAELQERLRLAATQQETQEAALRDLSRALEQRDAELSSSRAEALETENRLAGASQQLTELSARFALAEQLHTELRRQDQQTLEARDALLAGLKADLEARESLLAESRSLAGDLSARLAAADSQVGDLQQAKAREVAELRTSLTAVQAELAAARDKLGRLEAAYEEQVAGSAREGEAMRSRIAELGRELSSLQVLNSELQSKAQRLEKDYSAAEQQLLAAQQLFQEVLKSSEDRLRWGSSLDAEAKQLRELLTERELRLAEASARADELGARLERCEAELTQAAEARDRHADKVSRMQAAASWRLTAPLRFLRRVFIDKTES